LAASRSMRTMRGALSFLSRKPKALRRRADACSRACRLLVLPTRCRLLPDQLGRDYLPARLTPQLQAERRRAHRPLTSLFCRPKACAAECRFPLYPVVRSRAGSFGSCGGRCVESTSDGYVRQLAVAVRSRACTATLVLRVSGFQARHGEVIAEPAGFLCALQRETAFLPQLEQLESRADHGYLPTPICCMSVALSQNRYSSSMTPCLFQWPRVAIGRWYALPVG
jgi:hypothetical protein